MTLQELESAVQSAAKETFETMLGSEYQSGSPNPERGSLESDEALVATIGLGSNAIEAGMTLLFERSVAEYFVERMIGEEAPDLETIQDSVGEIANWIAGGVKGRLEQTEPSLTLSLPSVIAGKGLLVGKNSAATTIAFSFVIDQEHAVHGTMHLKQLGLARA